MDFEVLFRDAVVAHAADFSRAEVVASSEFRAALSEPIAIAEAAVASAICVTMCQLRTPIEIQTDETISYQIALACDFDRCQFIARRLLEHGNLNESITLIRRLAESLSRLKELSSTPLDQLARKTPNVKHALGQLSRLYGELSKIAHASDPGIMDFLKIITRGELIGPSVYPHFHTTSIYYFELLLYICVGFVVQMVVHLEYWYPSVDKTILHAAVTNMWHKCNDAELIDLHA